MIMKLVQRSANPLRIHQQRLMCVAALGGHLASSRILASQQTTSPPDAMHLCISRNTQRSTVFVWRGHVCVPKLVRFVVSVVVTPPQHLHSGGPNTNWSRFEDHIKPDGTPAIKYGARCGVACNFWELYEQDIALAASLGGNVFRLSLEWHRISPQQGKVDAEAVRRYHQIFDCIRSHGMVPFVTLHHFVQPGWFEDLGGFEQAVNVQHFVDFAAFAAREYAAHVQYVATFNEANVVANCGWVSGDFPPGKVDHADQAGKVLGNMYRAHALAYDAIKSQQGADGVQVGLVDSYMRWSALPGSGAGAEAAAAARDHMWANDITLRFLQSGKFVWSPPGGPSCLWTHTGGPRPLVDWMGINYYSRMVLGADLEPACYPGETLSTMGYALHAPGILEGLKHYSALGVPLYITETGFPDEHDTARPTMIDTYMRQLVNALEDPAVDLRGVMHWSLMDNWEWAKGWDEHFGLFAWTPGSAERVPRDRSVALWKQWCRYFLERGAGGAPSMPPPSP